MVAINETAPPKIFVDANVINDLCFNIPLEWLTEDFQRRQDGRYRGHRARWIDILPLLGELGLPIVIPTMVSLESGDVHHSGFQISKRFDRTALNRINDNRASFLIKAARSQDESKLWPNIAIIPPAEDDHTPSAQYVRTMTRAVNLFKHHQDSTAKEVVKRLQSQRKQDYGEEAAAELVRRENPQEQPLIYLSSDEQFHYECSHAKPTQPFISLNIQGLLKALHEGGFFQLIGLRSDITYEQIIENINQQESIAVEKLGHTNHRLIPERIIDTSHDFVSRKKKHGAFAALVADLKHKLSDSPRTEPDEAPEPVDPGVQAALDRQNAARRERFSRHPLANGRNGNGHNGAAPSR